ncbi:HAMP domain-containing protein, partial [Sinorhizobium fredii]|uniref:HAMP domain-containing protein n=1 Tax=Rhizobium fredii TaxID=380 RepID=UPI00056CCD81
MEGSPIFSRISTKLALMSGAGIFLMLAIIVGGWSIEHSVDEAITWRETQMGVSRDLVDAKASARGMQVAARDMLLAKSDEELQVAAATLNARRDSAVKYLDLAFAPLVVEKNKQRVVSIKALVEDYHGAAGRLQLVLAAKSDAEVALIVGQMQKVADEMAPLIDEGVSVAKKIAEETLLKRQQAQQFADVVEHGMAAAMVLLLIASAVFGARAIARPIGRITGNMTVLAGGDLDVDVPFTARRDEIGEMARAVELSKRNGIKVPVVYAQEAALQAKSADLQVSIGAVVSAAVAG